MLLQQQTSKDNTSTRARKHCVQKESLILDLQFLALSKPFLAVWKSLMACRISSSVVITNGPEGTHSAGRLHITGLPVIHQAFLCALI